jgi:hypothetical protein
MSSADVDLANPFNESADDSPALTPVPAPMAMPAREMRTVGGLMISAMSGLAALAPASIPQRAAVPAVENKTASR